MTMGGPHFLAPISPAEYAIEYAAYVSEKYIRRYTMPSEQETESALEELLGYSYRVLLESGLPTINVGSIYLP